MGRMDKQVPVCGGRVPEAQSKCAGCGLDYSKFQDYILPDDVWCRIAPCEDGSGLLCPTCIANKLNEIGLWYEDGYYKPDGYSAFNPLFSENERMRKELNAAKQDGVESAIDNERNIIACRDVREQQRRRRNYDRLTGNEDKRSAASWAGVLPGDDS